ncbi:MAG: hypothetical protein ABJN40_13030 [Sneathiella sp.]
MTQPASIDDIPGLFLRLLDRDEALVREMTEQGGDIKEKGAVWYFSLPSFFAVLQNLYPAFARVRYPAFRKALFASPVNQALMDVGWQVGLSESYGKVDQNIYCLRPVDPE